VSGCRMEVYSGTVEMVRSIGVPSGSGAVVMGTVRVTTLHPREMGKSKRPPLLEVMSPSSADSSRMVYSDDDPL
jgi:hypothetical protein